METTSLYYKQGGLDKVYQVAIVPSGDKYIVRYEFGRRGSTLQSGVKTALPVSHEHAKEIYRKLIQSKIAKGYQPGESGPKYQVLDGRDAAGILPQLANAIDAAEAATLIADSDWCMQEKFDGKRALIRKAGDKVEGINRNGLIVALPETIEDAAKQIPGSFLIDGECVGDRFIAFDLLEVNGVDFGPQPFVKRLGVLAKLIPFTSQYLRIADTVFGAPSKAVLIQQLRDANKEGAIFRKVMAPYLEGRPASGGDLLKLKFYETASFVVTALNRQRSVALGLLQDEKMVPAGKVTIPPNQAVPRIGTVVEVRYLYAFRESGRIFQPVYLGERSDIAVAACRQDQLKYKPDGLKEAA